MALDYQELIAKSILDIEHSYGDTEAMLYAQSVGFGRDPLDGKELNYVYEQGSPLHTVPTLASAIVPDMFPPDLGWDYSQVLHAEQRLQLYRPMSKAWCDISVRGRWSPRKRRYCAIYVGCDRGRSRRWRFWRAGRDRAETVSRAAPRSGPELRYTDAH